MHRSFAPDVGRMQPDNCDLKTDGEYMQVERLLMRALATTGRLQKNCSIEDATSPCVLSIAGIPPNGFKKRRSPDSPA